MLPYWNGDASLAGAIPDAVDVEFRVRSTARLFGARWREWTLGFYVTALVLWAVAAALAGSFILTAAALGVIGATLIWRTVADVDDAKTATALNAFKANALIGLAVAGAFALAGVWRVMGSLAGAP